MSVVVRQRDIVDIYISTLDAIREQSLPNQYTRFISDFPRDPIEIARALERVFGFKVSVKVADFYKKTPEIPDERRDLFSFYEFYEGGRVVVWINSNQMEVGRPLLSESTIRFAFTKEIFIAALKCEFESPRKSAERVYPATTTFEEFVGANISWIIEKPSIVDFGTGELSPPVAIENAAEILATLLLTDLTKLEAMTLAMAEDQPKAMAEFDFKSVADTYGLKVRYALVLLGTDFLRDVLADIRAAVSDVANYFSAIDPPEPWPNQEGTKPRP